MAYKGQFYKSWKDLEFSDNYMFCKVMENTSLCKQLLEKLLNIEIEEIRKPVVEKTIQPNYTSKGVRLDVYVKDSDRVFDLEMQTGNYDDLLFRARYYQVGLDTAETNHNTKYKDMKESYIIFICKDDPFGLGKPEYVRKMIFENCPDFIYNDKTHFIVYNSSAYEEEKDEEVKAILQFIFEQKAETVFTNDLKTEVNQMKEKADLEGQYMYFVDYVKEEKIESWEEGLEKGANDKAIATAKNLLDNGKLSKEEIAECAGLSIEKVEELAKEKVVLINK